MKINKKGFTLIELLVVIAIIGILAGIVLVSLTSVKNRATMASMKSTMASATTIATLCASEGETINGTTTAAGPICCANGNATCTAASNASAIITDLHPTLVGNVATMYASGYTYTAGAGGLPGTYNAAANAATGAVAIACDASTGSCL